MLLQEGNAGRVGVWGQMGSTPPVGSRLGNTVQEATYSLSSGVPVTYSTKTGTQPLKAEIMYISRDFICTKI